MCQGVVLGNLICLWLLFRIRTVYGAEALPCKISRDSNMLENLEASECFGRKTVPTCCPARKIKGNQTVTGYSRKDRKCTIHICFRIAS